MNTNILLATPCYGNVVCTNYLLSIIQLVSWAGQKGVPVTFFTNRASHLQDLAATTEKVEDNEATSDRIVAKSVWSTQIKSESILAVELS